MAGPGNRRSRRALPSDKSSDKSAPTARRVDAIVDALPRLVQSIRYDAGEGVTVIRFAVPLQAVALSARELRAVYQALGRCVEESTRVVLDVDAN